MNTTQIIQAQGLVAPHVGAWIEMFKGAYIAVSENVAPHVGAWIEIINREKGISVIRVAPHVGAWIEISVCLGSS